MELTLLAFHLLSFLAFDGTLYSPYIPYVVNTSSLLDARELRDPHFIGGRQVITQLFEWTFDEIAKECEEFLGPYGYGGVQTSPISENAVINPAPWDPNIKRPWYERYQVVSYNIITRSGNEQQFRNMVR